MTGNRFRKEDRLLKRPEFVRISNTGTRVHNRHFLVIYLPGDRERSRIGITVTKKVGNAVVRNRLKRLVREYFRTHRSRVPAHLDINLIVKREAAQLSSAQIFASLAGIFDKTARRSGN